MLLMTFLAFSTAWVEPARPTLYFLEDWAFFCVSGKLTSTPNSSLIFRTTAPCLPIKSGKYEGWTWTKFSEKSSYCRAQYPFSTSSLIAVSAAATALGSPMMVKSSPVVSMRETPVFSWIILILAPFGPMTIPTRFSGTCTVAVDDGPSSFFSSTATPAAFMARMRSTSAAADWLTPLAPALACAGAMPGMVFVGAGAKPGIDLPTGMAWSSFRSLRFCCFFVMPAETSQDPPEPSSMVQLGGSSVLSLAFGSSSATFAGALALPLAAGFAAAFGAAGGSAGAFAAALGAAGSTLAPALALALALAFGSAFGAGAGSGSALALAFPLAFAFGSAFGSGAGGAVASALALALLLALAFGSGA